MFKVRKIDINASHNYIATITAHDAKKLNLFPNERVKIVCEENHKSIICELQVFECVKECSLTLKNGEVGIFQKAFDKLCAKPNSLITIKSSEKPKSLEFVKRKFEGKRLKEREFELIIQEIVENKYSEVETTYFVLAGTAHPFNDKETISLTRAMVNAGKELKFRKGPEDVVVDKHCVGGIPNNRTTMIIVPIIAAAGLMIPKTSSRSITSPAGTADTMEVLCNVKVELDEMIEQVEDLGGCIVWGGSLDLSPADDIIIHVEHPLDIDSEGQMIASVLSKKKSAGSTHVLIDIPVGKTAKVTSRKKAEELARRFIEVGKEVGLEIRVIITDGSEPVGCGVGPALEAKDVMDILNGNPNAPQDLKEKSLHMAGIILEMAKVVQKDKGYETALHILESGIALEKMKKIIKRQGERKFPKRAKYTKLIKSKESGKIKSINNRLVSKLAFILGAPEDKTAGLILFKKSTEKIKKGENLFEIHSNSKTKFSYALEFITVHKDIFELE